MIKISASDRLKSALAALKDSAPHGERRITVAAVCRTADVSRNSLYRYHPEILRTLREQPRRGKVARRSSHAAAADRRELSALRLQAKRLAALADHFYAAYIETQALLVRRNQELAELRRRLDSKPLTLIPRASAARSGARP
jgi:AcrR family transcriptional regulator